MLIAARNSDGFDGHVDVLDPGQDPLLLGWEAIASTLNILESDLCQFIECKDPTCEGIEFPQNISEFPSQSGPLFLLAFSQARPAASQKGTGHGTKKASEVNKVNTFDDATAQF